MFQIEGSKVFDAKTQNSPLKAEVVEHGIYLREMPKAEEEIPFMFVPQSQVTFTMYKKEMKKEEEETERVFHIQD